MYAHVLASIIPYPAHLHARKYGEHVGVMRRGRPMVCLLSGYIYYGTLYHGVEMFHEPSCYVGLFIFRRITNHITCQHCGLPLSRRPH